jgi:hypothetical protein
MMMNNFRQLFKFSKNFNDQTNLLKLCKQQNEFVTETNNSSVLNKDLIGPADKISNIRKYKFHVPNDETKLERDYRLLREQVLEWNHQYWTQQNLNFIQSKRNFLENLNKSKQIDKQFFSSFGESASATSFTIKESLHSFNLDKSSTTNAESTNKTELENAAINEFYKKFLNDNYHNHYEYNKKWFKLNLKLLWPAVRVHFYRIGKQFKSKRTIKSSN